MKHTVSRFSAVAVFLACLAVLCLTMVPGPAEAKNRTTSEILTEVTAQPDGFFDVQLGDSEATFRKRMVNKRKEWRLLKDTSQQVQLDRVVPVSTKPVEKPVEGRVFAILHAGKIQRLEYVFMTDDAAAADRLMRTGASNLTKLLGAPRNNAPSVQTYTTDKKQVQYRFTMYDWEQGNIHIQLQESYRNPELVKGPDGKPYRAYYVAVRRWLIDPSVLEDPVPADETAKAKQEQ
ncbi:MAG: hypothetical protein ACOYKB_00715 [Succiniclasticum sp.]|jgi:hypothetical protein